MDRMGLIVKIVVLAGSSVIAADALVSDCPAIYAADQSL